MSADILNRPGLSELQYRIGTFGSFMAAMTGRLSTADNPALAALTTRDRSDPAIALLDAWAIVADVLTFYQERIANEGFLRTATEKRSVFELARLLGYKPRPGVAASVFLAYGLEKDARLTIKKDSRSQSLPGVGELPQTYETSASLVARAEWNNLAPRLSIPQNIGEKTQVLYFKGATLGLKPHDPLLFVRRSGTDEDPLRFVRIHSVEASFEKGITKVVLDPPPLPEPFSKKEVTFSKTALDVAHRLRGGLAAASTAPAIRDGEPSALLESSGIAEVLAELDPRVPIDQLTAASARADMSRSAGTEVYAFRVHSAPFGHNAPKRAQFAISTRPGFALAAEPQRGVVGYEEWTLGGDAVRPLLAATPLGFEDSDSITLDSAHETLLPRSWVAIVRPIGGSERGLRRGVLVRRADDVEVLSRSDYGVTSRVTRIALPKRGRPPITPPKLKSLEFEKGWLEPELVGSDSSMGFGAIRDTEVYAQSERLEPAELPLSEPVWNDTIELDRLYDGLDEGRWLIVEGERADLLQDRKEIREALVKKNVEITGQAVDVPPSGVRTAELVRVAAVKPLATHGQADTLHSHVIVSPPLAHAYKRDTVIIHGNVVLATHGDTRNEVLGSGEATKPYQTFALRQGPITFVPAPTASGAASSLEVRVNDILWHEVESLVGAKPDDRVFAAELDDKGRARIVFGDGRRGARVPTGVENVKAKYRVGIGAAGNAAAGRVSQLMDRPLGAKEVINPLPAQGGGDPDTADQAREIAPLSVKALDRLVSVSDYRDFAQLFAGIAKATASEGWDGTRPKIVVTVAAAGGRPIAGSALYTNLRGAMQRLGVPSRAVELIDFERHLLVLEAGVRLLPDYLFASVKPKIQGALFDAFNFEKRRLGDELPLSHVLTVMHGVEGVQSVDVKVFATISAEDVESDEAIRKIGKMLSGGGTPPDRLPAARTVSGTSAPQKKPVNPGWLVYASPGVPGAIRLVEIP